MSDQTQKERMTRDELLDLLPLCGCGNPDAAARLVLDVLRLHPLWDNRGWERIRELLPSDGLVFLVLGVLDDLGLTDHGTTITGAWLTPMGEEVRAALECEVGDDNRGGSS